MVIINNKKFAETDREYIDALFMPGGTCVGFAKRARRTIKFYDTQKNIKGVVNQEAVLGSACQLDTKKVWYSYGEPKIIGTFSDYATQREAIYDLATGRDAKGLIFKA
jgi:hypothetical protein